MQNLLRTAHAKGLTSIVIPSLGVGNLHYPVNVSAQILFDEVIAFHARNPSAIQMFHFVIYKKEDYEAFKREYSQHMSEGSVFKLVRLFHNHNCIHVTYMYRQCTAVFWQENIWLSVY